jgi:hypothetical protein
MQEAMMAMDTGGPMAEANSPMPKANIPLVPAAPTNPQISDMMNFMKDCMDQQSKRLGMQLEPLIHRIEHLEAPKPDYDNMVPDYIADEYNTWTNPHDDLEYQSIEPTYPAPPPRIDDDEIMRDMDNAHAANIAAFNADAEEEDEYRTLYNMGLAPTDEQIQKEAEAEFWTTDKIQEAKLAKLAWLARRTLYLQSRHSVTDPQPTTSNQQVAGSQASQPITISSGPPTQPKPKPTFATAAATAPKAGSVWTVVGKKINPCPCQQPPTNAASPPKQPLSAETLSAHRTTKATIIEHGYATFSIHLSEKITKPQLIVAYQQLTSNPKLTPPQPTAHTGGPPPNRQQQPLHPFTSEWTI